MLDTPFDFFALLIAVVAFIFARKAFNQSAVLRARLRSCLAAKRLRDIERDDLLRFQRLSDEVTAREIELQAEIAALRAEIERTRSAAGS